MCCPQSANSVGNTYPFGRRTILIWLRKATDKLTPTLPVFRPCVSRQMIWDHSPQKLKETFAV